SKYFTGLLLLWEQDPEIAKNQKWEPVRGSKIGNVNFAILDGQQRLSSLYFAIYNPIAKFPDMESFCSFTLHIEKYLDKEYDDCVEVSYSRSHIELSSIKASKMEYVKNLEL